MKSIKILSILLLIIGIVGAIPISNETKVEDKPKYDERNFNEGRQTGLEGIIGGLVTNLVAQVTPTVTSAVSNALTNAVSNFNVWDLLTKGNLPTEILTGNSDYTSYLINVPEVGSFVLLANKPLPQSQSSYDLDIDIQVQPPPQPTTSRPIIEILNQKPYYAPTVASSLVTHGGDIAYIQDKSGVEKFHPHKNYIEQLHQHLQDTKDKIYNETVNTFNYLKTKKESTVKYDINDILNALENIKKKPEIKPQYVQEEINYKPQTVEQIFYPELHNPQYKPQPEFQQTHYKPQYDDSNIYYKPKYEEKYNNHHPIPTTHKPHYIEKPIYKPQKIHVDQLLTHLNSLKGKELENDAI